MGERLKGDWPLNLAMKVTARKFRGKRPVLKEDVVMVVANAVERELREINRRTEVDPKWSDTGVERVLRLLEVVRLNRTRLEF